MSTARWSLLTGICENCPLFTAHCLDARSQNSLSDFFERCANPCVHHVWRATGASGDDV